MEIDGIVHPTVKGVPQGGVVSPLLANVVLNKLDWFIHSKGFHGNADNLRRWSHNLPNVRFARYADDWCVFLTRCNRQYAERLKDEIRDFLRETCGLELSAEKTRITHVRDGYDFLGFNISTGVGKAGKVVPKIKVGRKALTNIQTRLGEALRYRPTQESISVRLVRASAVIRGWSNYFKIAHNFSQVANGLDHEAYWIAAKAICRKENISTAKCLRKYGRRGTIGVHKDCTLAHFQDTAATYYYSSPEPYQPGSNQPYLEDDEWEAAFVLPDRPGQAAETSSGRLWSATAFIAVGARSWLHPRLRMRTISNLSTALPTSKWRTAWTTSRPVSTLSQTQNREGTMRVESSGKPDAWKLARPVWGWGRGETPRPTPQVPEEDKRLNDQALLDGSRLLSAYRTLKGERIWIITEAVGDDGKRSATTILLPSQY